MARKILRDSEALIMTREEKLKAKLDPHRNSIMKALAIQYLSKWRLTHFWHFDGAKPDVVLFKQELSRNIDILEQIISEERKSVSSYEVDPFTKIVMLLAKKELEDQTIYTVYDRLFTDYGLDPENSTEDANKILAKLEKPGPVTLPYPMPRVRYKEL